MRKAKNARLIVSRETLKRLDQPAEAKQVAGGAVITRGNCPTVPFTDWPTCDPIT